MAAEAVAQWVDEVAPTGGGAGSAAYFASVRGAVESDEGGVVDWEVRVCVVCVEADEGGVGIQMVCGDLVDDRVILVDPVMARGVTMKSVRRQRGQLATALRWRRCGARVT